MTRGTVRWDVGTGVPKEIEGRYEFTSVDADGCYVPVLKVYEDKRGEWGSPHVYIVPLDRLIHVRERA